MEFALGGLEHLVRAVEAALLLVLVAEGLRRPHTGQARLNLGVDSTGLLLGGAARAAHAAPPVHHRQHEHRQNHAHDQRHAPLDRKHHRERAHDRHDRDKEILGAMVRQLRQLKEVGCQAAHELAGAVLVVEVEAQLLHVREEVAADVRLDADAEGVAPVAHDEKQDRADDKRDEDDRHHGEEHTVALVRQPVVHRCARDQRKRQIHQRDEKGTGHIEQEQPPVRAEIGEKNPHGGAGLEVPCGHGRQSFHGN